MTMQILEERHVEEQLCIKVEDLASQGSGKKSRTCVKERSKDYGT